MFEVTSFITLHKEKFNDFSNISETIFISHRLILPEYVFIRLYLLFNINLDETYASINTIKMETAPILG